MDNPRIRILYWNDIKLFPIATGKHRQGVSDDLVIRSATQHRDCTGVFALVHPDTVSTVKKRLQHVECQLWIRRNRIRFRKRLVDRSVAINLIRRQHVQQRRDLIELLQASRRSLDVQAITQWFGGNRQRSVIPSVVVLFHAQQSPSHKQKRVGIGMLQAINPECRIASTLTLPSRCNQVSDHSKLRPRLTHVNLVGVFEDHESRIVFGINQLL